MLFPIVVLLGLNGLVVGILNAYDHFTIPALAPLVWNLVIIAWLVGLTPLFTGDDQLYAYAIGVAGRHGRAARDGAARRCAGSASACRSHCTGATRASRQVLRLMLPVTLGLGLINIDLVINTVLGSLVSDEAPRAIDAAFRIYMLPAGHVLRRGRDRAVPGAQPARRAPRLRRAAAHGRQRHAPDRAAADPGGGGDGSCSPTPITRLVYQRGAFDAESTATRSSEALFWFSFSLPFAGRQPAAHPHVLLAPAAVAADRAGAALAASSTSCVSARALQAARDRGDRASAPRSAARP